MRHGHVERLGRLREQRSTVVVDRAGDHRRDLDAMGLAVFVDGKQTRLEDEDVVARFNRKEVDASGNEGLDLSVVAGDEIVVGVRPRSLILAARFDVERLRRWPDAARDKARLVGIATREVVGRMSGQLGRLSVNLTDDIVEAKLLQGDGVAVEGAGFDDIGPGIEILAMDALDQLRLGQNERFRAILERHGMTAKSLTAVVFFRGLMREDQRPHRPVEQQDVLGHEFVQDFSVIRSRQRRHSENPS